MTNPERFELIRLLGKGGLAQVYLARDRSRPGEPVALKNISGEHLKVPEVRKRFAREAKIQSEIRHPNLVRVYECRLDVAQPYLVMECVEGKDLSRVIRERGTLPLPEVLRIAREIGGALDALHEQGVIHRDLKPANVMMRDRDGSAMVMDLGLAALRDATVLTRTGQLLGTPRYFPPEVLLAKPWTAAGDQFQVAAIVFEALTGVSLVPGKDMETLLQAIKTGEWTPFPPDRPDIPEGIRQAIRKATSIDPEARFPNCSAFAAALHEAARAAGAPTQALAPGLVPGEQPGTGTASRRWLAILGAVGMGLGIFFPWGPPPPTDLVWTAVGDAIAVEFRRQDVEGIRLAVAGEVHEIPFEPKDGRFRGVRHGLPPGSRVEAKLVWKGGESAPFGFVPDPPAIAPELRFGPDRTFLVQVRRPCRAHWGGSPEAVVDLATGTGRMPFRATPAEVLILHFEEQGIESEHRIRLGELAESEFDRLERALPAAGVPAAVTAAIREGRPVAKALADALPSWDGLASWVPDLLAFPPLANRRAWLWERTEDMALLEHALRARGEGIQMPRLLPGSLGSRFSTLPTWRRVETHTAKVRAPEDRGRRAEAAEIQLTSELPGILVRRHPGAATEAWTTLPPGLPRTQDAVYLSLRARRLPVDQELRMEAGDPDSPSFATVFRHPAPGPGVEPEFRTWLTVAVPGSLLPGSEVPIRLRMVPAWGAPPDTGWIHEDMQVSHVPANAP